MSAIGYARSLERIIDFMSDMKDTSLPHKLTNEYKVQINIDEIQKYIDKLGVVNHQGQFDSPADLGQITNDFSKPKNKISDSKILPEIVQSI